MHIYKLSTYYDDSYSYSGISVAEEIYFIHKTLAENYAKEYGYKIVSFAETMKDATIDEIDVVEN